MGSIFHFKNLWVTSSALTFLSQSVPSSCFMIIFKSLVTLLCCGLKGFLNCSTLESEMPFKKCCSLGFQKICSFLSKEWGCLLENLTWFIQERIQNRRKYFQIVYLIKKLYLEYIWNYYNFTIKSPHFKTDETFSDCEVGEILAWPGSHYLPKPWTLSWSPSIKWIDFPFPSTPSPWKAAATTIGKGFE